MILEADLLIMEGDNIEKEQNSKLKKTTSKKNDNYYDVIETIKKGATNATNASVNLTKTVSAKIEESALKKIQQAKSHPLFNKLKDKTVEAVKISSDKGKEIQEKSPPILSRLGHKSLLGFEKFVGTIRRGTQYGKTSIEMLEQFTKMKELGIITEEEFEAKKKEILDRI